jgi:maltodextrin utilization protein YvdJ
MTNYIEQPITMDDSNQPTPPGSQHHVAHSFINLFLEAVTKHIDMLVETKFNAMVENRRALTLMDEALERRINDKITEAMAEHEINEDHLTREDIEGIASDAARGALKEYARTQEGWVTEDEVKDIITQHVDEEIDGIDWDERVKDVIRDLL